VEETTADTTLIGVDEVRDVARMLLPIPASWVFAIDEDMLMTEKLRMDPDVLNDAAVMREDEALWLDELLCSWAEDPGIVAEAGGLDTVVGMERATVVPIPELPIAEPTTVVTGFAALTEIWVETIGPAPTSTRLPPPAVWITPTLVLPTPTLIK
jgi:hypothetical protein